MCIIILLALSVVHATFSSCTLCTASPWAAICATETFTELCDFYTASTYIRCTSLRLHATLSGSLPLLKGHLVTKIDKLYQEGNLLHFTHTVSPLHKTYNFFIDHWQLRQLKFLRGFFHFHSFSCQISGFFFHRIKAD